MKNIKNKIVLNIVEYWQVILVILLSSFFLVASISTYKEGESSKNKAEQEQTKYINQLISLSLKDLYSGLVKIDSSLSAKESIVKNCYKLEQSGRLNYIGLFNNIQIIKNESILCGYDNNKEDFFKFQRTIGDGESALTFKGNVNSDIFIPSDIKEASISYTQISKIFLILSIITFVFGFIFLIRKEKQKQTNLDFLTNMPSIHELKVQETNNKRFKTASVAILDLDYFQGINDTYGHQVGDMVIKKVATLIKKWSQKKHLAFRLNGEKFLIVMPEGELIDEIFELEFLLKSIKHLHINVEDHNVDIGVSGTIGFCRNKNISFDERRKLATIALKEQKKTKKGLIREKNYKETATNYEIGNELTTKDIAHMWKEKNIFFEYQPIMIEHGKETFTIYEALIRLNNQGQIFYPPTFLSKIKNSVIEEEMTKYVIGHHLEMLSNTKDIIISVNVDNKSLLQEDIIEMLKEYWTNNGKDYTKRLMIEIVEYDGVVSYEEISEKIKFIRNMGYKIAIDDFGSGYSNFTHILKMEVDFIKIDGEIIKNIMENESSMAIAKAIKFLSDQLNIPVIAEYVASESVYNILRKIGIQNVQGYYISKPLPKDEMSNFLENS